MSSDQEWDIKGKVCLVTGANGGIGKETVLGLIKQGAGRVIMACRNLETGKEALDYVRKEAGITDDAEAERRLVIRKLDLGSLKSIRQFAEVINKEEKELNLLVNNAAVYAPAERTLTEDGFELSFGTNHLGPFLLTNLLLDLIKRSGPARIVSVSSLVYFICWPWGFHIDDYNCEKGWRYDAYMAYCHSKLANMLFIRWLDRRLNGDGPSGVTCYSLHPGSIKTDLMIKNRSYFWQWVMWPFQFLLSTTAEGARTSLHCSTTPGIEKYSGHFFRTCQMEDPFAFAKDYKMAERLWNLSEKLVGLQ